MLDGARSGSGQCSPVKHYSATAAATATTSTLHNRQADFKYGSLRAGEGRGYEPGTSSQCVAALSPGFTCEFHLSIEVHMIAVFLCFLRADCAGRPLRRSRARVPGRGIAF